MRSVLSSLERMRRRPLSTLLVLTLLGAVLLIGAASGTLLYDLRQLTDELQGEVGLVAYLADAAPPGRLEELARELERLPGVQRVRPVPRRLALADLRASLGEDADLIDELGPELLPDSLEVVPVPGGSPEGELAALSTRIGRLEGIATVWRAGTGRGSVARMAALLSLLQLGGGAIMLVMVALVAWIVAGVVGLAFAARSDEVHLLRLLGASESFIRRPFLLEGSLLSLTAGLLSIVGLLGLVGALRAILGPEAILAGIHLALPPPWLCAGYVLGGGLV
ncbi:MAG: FtsX-like permease family protein, partial [Deltaproteobacteria bacterium]|nr:FtsX-like permease family protein [Deltaproteobacteria bacterium]